MDDCNTDRYRPIKHSKEQQNTKKFRSDIIRADRN